MAVKLGLNARLYYLLTGTRATWGTIDTDGMYAGAAPASLSPITRVRDVTIGIEKGDADVSTRDNDGWRANLGTLKDGSLEFEIVWDPPQLSHTALLKSLLLNTTIAVAALDGDKATVATQGLWADMEVTNFSKMEELEEGQKISVTLKPALGAIPPQWVRVTV
jgi:hypothetical protein